VIGKIIVYAITECDCNYQSYFNVIPAIWAGIVNNIRRIALIVPGSVDDDMTGYAARGYGEQDQSMFHCDGPA